MIVQLNCHTRYIYYAISQTDGLGLFRPQAARAKSAKLAKWRSFWELAISQKS